MSSIGAIVVDGKIYPARTPDQRIHPVQQQSQTEQEQSMQSRPQQMHSPGSGKSVMKSDLSSRPQVSTSFVSTPSESLSQVRSTTASVTVNSPLTRINRVSPIGAITHQVSDAPETWHNSMKYFDSYYTSFKQKCFSICFIRIGLLF